MSTDGGSNWDEVATEQATADLGMLGIKEIAFYVNATNTANVKVKFIAGITSGNLKKVVRTLIYPFHV